MPLSMHVSTRFANENGYQDSLCGIRVITIVLYCSELAIQGGKQGSLRLNHPFKQVYYMRLHAL